MRQRRAAATGGSVMEEERARGGDGDEGESARGVGAAAWRRGESSRPSGCRQAGWRWPDACRRAAATRAAFWREEEGDRRGWWAGPACYSAGPKVSAFSLFLFPISFSVSFVLQLCLINKNARLFL